MDDIGTVVSLSGTSAVVKINKSKKCNACKACTFLPGQDAVNVLAENTKGAAVGDTVRVKAEKPLAVKASLLCYLMPLAFALVGMAIGVFFGELITICAFFGGLFLGYVVLRVFERAVAKKREYRPAVAEILKKGEEAQN
jgi:positive regulator of sigma E activity